MSVICNLTSVLHDRRSLQWALATSAEWWRYCKSMWRFSVGILSLSLIWFGFLCVFVCFTLKSSLVSVFIFLLLFSNSMLCRPVPPRWNRGHVAKLYFLRTSWLLCIAKPRIAGNDHCFSTFSNFCYNSIFVSKVKDSWEQCFCHPRILEHDHTHSASAWQPAFVHSVLSLPLSLSLSLSR